MVEDQVVPAEDIPEDPEPWEDEPTTLEQLLDLYVVEGKVQRRGSWWYDLCHQCNTPQRGEANPVC